MNQKLIWILIASICVTPNVVMEASAQAIPGYLQDMFDETDRLIERTDQWLAETDRMKQAAIDELAVELMDDCLAANPRNSESDCRTDFGECDSYGYTNDECAYVMGYTDFATREMINSIDAKDAAKSKQIDDIYRANMCPASDGTFGDYC